jgi:biopolymer transport protein TolR
MGMGVVAGRRGILSEVNVVPLIDILLVLLVIFMIIPHRQKGLEAAIPQQQDPRAPIEPSETITVQIASDGSVRINQSEVRFEQLGDRVKNLFARRSERVAFLQADRSLEFQAVARVLDLMRSAGASPVGLLSSELEKNR